MNVQQLSSPSQKPHWSSLWISDKENYEDHGVDDHDDYNDGGDNVDDGDILNNMMNIQLSSPFQKPHWSRLWISDHPPDWINHTRLSNSSSILTMGAFFWKVLFLDKKTSRHKK